MKALFSLIILNHAFIMNNQKLPSNLLSFNLGLKLILQLQLAYVWYYKQLNAIKDKLITDLLWKTMHN